MTLYEFYEHQNEFNERLFSEDNVDTLLANY